MEHLPCETDVCEQLCEHPRIVCLVKAEILSPEDARQIADSFKLLGDPTRVRILHALSLRELCVCDLAAVVAMEQSAVSHQLRLLRTARLVKSRKEGKVVWYSLDDQHIVQLLSQGIEHRKHV